MSSTKKNRAAKISENGSAANGSSPKKKSLTRSPKKGAHPVLAADQASLIQQITTLKTMLEHTKDALILFDPEGKVLTFNQAAVKLYLEHNQKQIKEGVSIYDLVRSERHQPTKKNFRGCSTRRNLRKDCTECCRRKRIFFQAVF